MNNIICDDQSAILSQCFSCISYINLRLKTGEHFRQVVNLFSGIVVLINVKTAHMVLSGFLFRVLDDLVLEIVVLLLSRRGE